MGFRHSFLGRPENPVEKAAQQAVGELVGYKPVGITGSLGSDRIEVKDGAIHVCTCNGLAESSESFAARHDAAKAKLEAAGLAVERLGTFTDTIATGISTASLGIRADQNGGFSGIADKVNEHLGKAQGGEKSHVAAEDARRASGQQQGQGR